MSQAPTIALALFCVATAALGKDATPDQDGSQDAGEIIQAEIGSSGLRGAVRFSRFMLQVCCTESPWVNVAD